MAPDVWTVLELLWGPGVWAMLITVLDGWQWEASDDSNRHQNQ
jgi:hypothetical protein